MLLGIDSSAQLVNRNSTSLGGSNRDQALCCRLLNFRCPRSPPSEKKNEFQDGKMGLRAPHKIFAPGPLWSRGSHAYMTNDVTDKLILLKKILFKF